MPWASATGHSQVVHALRQDDSGYAGQVEELSDFFPHAFVYWNAPGSLPDNPGSILETEKSRSLMTCKLDEAMYWKMPVAAMLLHSKVWLSGTDSGAPQLGSSGWINAELNWHSSLANQWSGPLPPPPILSALPSAEGLLHWEKPYNTDQRSHLHLPEAQKIVRFEWPRKTVIQPQSPGCSWIFTLNCWYRRMETDMRIKTPELVEFWGRILDKNTRSF